MLWNGTGLTASIGCTCCFFSDRTATWSAPVFQKVVPVFSMSWTGFTAPRRAPVLEKEKINLLAKFWHTSYVWNRINSLFRMHLLVLLRHDLQHLGVHLFSRKFLLGFYTVLPVYGVKRNRLTASVGYTCVLFLRPDLSVFYEQHWIYSTWGCTCFQESFFLDFPQLFCSGLTASVDCTCVPFLRPF